MATDSILDEVKEFCNVSVDDSAFDTEIRMHINSAFSTLNQIGIGPDAGFSIEDDSATWDEFIDEGPMLDKVKTYLPMKVRFAFDMPGTGYHTTAMQEIIKEEEVRLSYMREDEEWVAPEPVVVVVDIFGDPIDPYP